MGKLIINENMKIYRRWRSWIMVAFLIGAVLLGSIVEWYYDGSRKADYNWQNEKTAELKIFEEELKEDDLHEDDRKYYERRVAVINYHLEHHIEPTDGTMWEGINDSAELVILITLFMVIIAGDSLAGEFTSGTIKLLLIRPASRLKILVSKYISVILYGLLLLAILFIVSVLTNGLLYQFENLDLPLVNLDSAGTITEQNMIGNLWKTYMLNSVSTIMIVTMAFMISAAFRSSAMAIGFSMFAMFTGTILVEVLQRYEWSKYILFANIDLTQHLSGRPFQEGMTLGFSIMVLIAYYVIFNLAAWLVFTRRDVAS